jgi:hypothetical protein
MPVRVGVHEDQIDLVAAQRLVKEEGKTVLSKPEH